MRLKYCKEHIQIVNDIMNDPEVYESMADDYSGDTIGKNIGKMILGSPLHHLLHPSNGILFLITINSFTLHEVHTMVKKANRGIEAVGHTRNAAMYHFANTSCEKIITHIPVFNKAAYRFARKVGMELIGMNTKSFKRNGQLIDQYILGLEKEKLLCQQFQL